MFARDRIRSRNKRRDDSPSVWRHIFIGLGVCSVVALGIFSVWHITRLPVFTISTVTVLGGGTIAPESIREEVDSLLRGSYFKIIPYTFSLMYPQERIASAIASIPRVKDVAVAREAETLTVTFTEYEPYALWCQPVTNSCYFLDETGYAFAPGPRLTGGALVRHIFEDVEILEQKQIFEPAPFALLHKFLERLDTSLRLRVTDVVHTTDGDLRIMVNGGGELILAQNESYDAAFDNLASVLRSEEFKHIEPGNFKYIDLRFGSKIFVNEKLVPDTVATSSDEIASTTEE